MRSSANAEDLPGLSFAGQQETFLNVHGQEELLSAVQRCWASLWTTRAISYRYEMGIDQAAVAMAVVVQLMVPSDVAGVLFTVNPVTGERSEMVVNASYGLGEAVVSGQVTPDTYVVDRQSMQTKETIIGAKEKTIISDKGQGTQTRDVPDGQRDQSSLSEKHLAELAERSLEIERLFEGVPSDIEWAVSDGKLWLLQARPITNLPPAPIEDVSWDPPPPTRELIRKQVVELMPEPLSPLFEDLYLKVGQTLATNQFFAYEKFPFAAAGPFYVAVNGYGYFRSDPGDRLPLSDGEKKHRKRSLWHRFSYWCAVKVPVVGIFPSWLVKVRDWKKFTLPTYMNAIERWRKVKPAESTERQLYEGVRELTIADAVFWGGRASTSKVFGVAKVSDQLLQTFLQEALPEEQLTSGVFLSGFASKPLQANEDLWNLAQRIRENEALYELTVLTPPARLMDALQEHDAGGPVLEALTAYLRTNGHTVYNIDYVVPTMIEEPDGLLATLKSMVVNPGAAPSEHQQRLTVQRAEALEKVRRLLRGKLAWKFRWYHWQARHFYPLREESMFYMGAAWPVLRTLALELGKRLTSAGALAEPGDIFYLTSTEIERAIDAQEGGRAMPKYGEAVLGRRELREARKRLQPPAVLPVDAWEKLSSRAVQKRNDASSDTLSGFAVSPGTVTGEASVILSPEDFSQMKPGTILVCPMTTPAWTQLFPHAIGLVTDIGGITAHGSIVAREYGIPAVLGTGNITERVKSGQTITIDGDSGVVSLVEDLTNLS